MASCNAMCTNVHSEKHITVREFIERTGINKTTVHRMIKRGQLPIFPRQINPATGKPYATKVWIRESAVNELLNQSTHN